MATIDLSNLVDSDETPTEVPVLTFGGTTVRLPAFPPTEFVAALGNLAWAKRVESEVDLQHATAELVRIIGRLAGPLADGRVNTNVLLRGVIAAYNLGEGSASSD